MREKRQTQVESKSSNGVLTRHSFLPTSTSQKPKARRGRNSETLIEGHGTPRGIPRRTDNS